MARATAERSKADRSRARRMLRMTTKDECASIEILKSSYIRDRSYRILERNGEIREYVDSINEARKQLTVELPQFDWTTVG